MPGTLERAGIDWTPLFQEKALAGLAKHLPLLLAIAMALSGCTVGFAQWQAERAKVGTEFRHMRTEQQERAHYTQCVDQGAMPGSPENLQCQMEMAKKERQAGAQTLPEPSPRP